MMTVPALSLVSRSRFIRSIRLGRSPPLPPSIRIWVLSRALPRSSTRIAPEIPPWGTSRGVWGFDSGIYRLAETNGVRGYTHDASGTAVQADLDRLPGNSTGDSFWLGQDRHDVGSLSGLASIDAARKYYYGNSTSALAGIRLLDNTTFVAGTASHTDYRLVDVFTGHNPQPDDVIVFEGHGRPQFDPDYVGQTAVNPGWQRMGIGVQVRGSLNRSILDCGQP